MISIGRQWRERERERGSEREADSFRNHGSTFLKGKLEEYVFVNDPDQVWAAANGVVPLF